METRGTPPPPGGASRSRLPGIPRKNGHAPASIQIEYQIDDFPPERVVANLNQPALKGRLHSTRHGFSVKFPKLPAGKHVIAVYAVDSTSGDTVLLQHKTVTVSNPAGNPLPYGGIDSFDAAGITGWVYDPSVKAGAIRVRVDVDGVIGVPVLAEQPEAALPATVIGTNHGFTVPLDLSAGEHLVNVYAIDNRGTSVLVAGQLLETPANSVLGALDAGSEIEKQN